MPRLERATARAGQQRRVEHVVRRVDDRRALAAERTGDAIRALSALAPETAWLRLPDGQWTERPSEQVSLGAVLRIRAGERVPLDGQVIEGRSSLDESMVTGESMPVVKNVGHVVIGGCVNGSGALRIRVTAVGADTVLAGIIRMVDCAQAAKLPIQKIVDQVSAVFVPSVIAMSGLTLAGWLAAGASATRAVRSRWLARRRPRRSRP